MFQEMGKYRGEKLLKASFVELAVVIAALLVSIIAGFAIPFLGSVFVLTNTLTIVIHKA